MHRLKMSQGWAKSDRELYTEDFSKLTQFSALIPMLEILVEYLQHSVGTPDDLNLGKGTNSPKRLL